MKTRSFLLLFVLLLVGQLLASRPATAQVIRGNISFGPPPRAYYGPRCYYPPRPAVVYAVPPPVVVVPGPYYAPRAYYAPRPYYGYRGRGRWGRRW